MGVSVVRPRCLEILKKVSYHKSGWGKKYILLNSGGDVILIMNGKYLKLSIGLKNITAFE